MIGSPLTRINLAAAGLTAVAALGLTVASSGGVASAAPLSSSAPALPSSATVSSSSPALAAVTTATPQRTHRAHGPTYTVQPGDSFWSIAAAHHDDWYNLAADNGLTMYTVLNAGQVLRLPAPGEAAHAPMPLQPGAVTASGSVPSASGAPSSSPTSTGGAAAPVATPSAPSTYSGATSSFEQCVISRESGGNPQATNGAGYWGLFQFSAATWAAYGGNPADFGWASAGEQEQVFNNAMAAGGESNWAPYDGC